MFAVELGVALVVPALVAVPHFMPLHRVNPSLAALVWMFALALRALVAVGGAIFLLVYLPRTGVYDAVAHWCWHKALPLVATHLGLSGHPLIHAAIVLPGLALAASVLWLAFGIARAWLALRLKLSRPLGEGPLGSTIIEDDSIVVGVTGIGRSKIVISDAALDVMDSAELEASLCHELGHIRRRHRPLLLLASVLSALGRVFPGTAAAERELRFNLERDADQYAVTRTRDPLALASAICKAATGQALRGATGLGGSDRVALRLDYLEGQQCRPGSALERATRVLAVTLVLAVAALFATLPSWAMAVPRAEHTLSATNTHCVKDGGR